MSAPDTLKVRLERLKHASNLRLDFLKRLYDRRSVGELYCSGESNLHIHFRTVGSYCATYCAGHITEVVKMVPVNDVNREFTIGLSGNKGPVLVGVGQVFENGRPVTSTVRLQRLDCCNMCGIESVEPSSIYPPFKSLSLVFDRKLGAIYDEPGIENRKFIDQIIERRPEIITNFSDQDAKAVVEGEFHVPYDDLIRVFRIGLNQNHLHLFAPPSSGMPYKISKVFFCPT